MAKGWSPSWGSAMGPFKFCDQSNSHPFVTTVGILSGKKMSWGRWWAGLCVCITAGEEIVATVRIEDHLAATWASHTEQIHEAGQPSRDLGGRIGLASILLPILAARMKNEWTILEDRSPVGSAA